MKGLSRPTYPPPPDTVQYYCSVTFDSHALHMSHVVLYNLRWRLRNQIT